MGNSRVREFPKPDEDAVREVMMTPIADSDALQPKTIGQALEWARILCDSALVPESIRGNPADVLIAILFGRELGLSVVQSLQNVAVVNGRATVWGDAPLGIVERRAGDLLEDFEEGWNTDDAENPFAWCKVKRKNRPLVERTFSKSDAATAGLLTKKGELYQKYLRRMCKFKARNEALRDAFPDILLGIASREDAHEWADINGAIETTAVAAESADTRTRPKTIAEMLAALQPEEAEHLVKAFDALNLSEAERRVKLRAFQGREGDLLKELREEYVLQKTRGAHREPTKKAGEKKAETPTPAEEPTKDSPPTAVRTPDGAKVDVGTGELLTEPEGKSDDAAPKREAPPNLFF